MKEGDLSRVVYGKVQNWEAPKPDRDQANNPRLPTADVFKQQKVLHRVEINDQGVFQIPHTALNILNELDSGLLIDGQPVYFGIEQGPKVIFSFDNPEATPKQ